MAEHSDDLPADAEKQEGSGTPESIWNLDHDLLFEMNQAERDQIFDERTNRLREALLALSNGASPEEIKTILDRPPDLPELK